MISKRSVEFHGQPRIVGIVPTGYQFNR